MLVKTKRTALKKDGKMRYMLNHVKKDGQVVHLEYVTFINGRLYDIYNAPEFTEDYVKAFCNGYNHRRIGV